MHFNCPEALTLCYTINLNISLKENFHWVKWELKAWPSEEGYLRWSKYCLRIQWVGDERLRAIMVYSTGLKCHWNCDKVYLIRKCGHKPWLAWFVWAFLIKLTIFPGFVCFARNSTECLTLSYSVIKHMFLAKAKVQIFGLFLMFFSWWMRVGFMIHTLKMYFLLFFGGGTMESLTEQ